jgi:hypothetical protein
MPFGSLFSSKSKSTSTSTNEELTSNAVDNRVVDSDSAFVEGNFTLSSSGTVGNVNVSKTDFGALDTAGNIAESALSFANSASERANETLSSAVKSTVGAVQSIASNVTKDESAESIKFAIVGAAVIGLGFVIVRYSKG